MTFIFCYCFCLHGFRRRRRTVVICFVKNDDFLSWQDHSNMSSGSLPRFHFSPSLCPLEGNHLPPSEFPVSGPPPVQYILVQPDSQLVAQKCKPEEKPALLLTLYRQRSVTFTPRPRDFISDSFPPHITADR